MTPELVTVPEFLLIGLEARTSYDEELDSTSSKLLPLWGQIQSDSAIDKIPNKTAADELNVVFTNYDSDYRGDYSVVIGTRVSTLFDIPNGFAAIALPTRTYLRFGGEAPVIELWQQIHRYFESNPSHQRAYADDFERYQQPYLDRIEIFVSVL